MTKKEKEMQEKADYLNKIINEDIEYDDEKEELVLNFIFNILTSNTVMNRYCSTRYGNITENKDISIKECINYVAKKIIEFNKRKDKEEKIEYLKREIEKLEQSQIEVIGLGGDDLPIREEIWEIEEQIRELRREDE